MPNRRALRYWLEVSNQKDKSGLFYEPTIIECPNQGLRIVDKELFGPVLCVQRFKTEDEVLSLANDTEHGLAAGNIYPKFSTFLAYGRRCESRHCMG